MSTHGKKDKFINLEKTEVEMCQEHDNDNTHIEKAMGYLPIDEEILGTSNYFAALSEPNRLKILYILKNGEYCPCELSEILGCTKSALSHQLRILKDKNLIKNRKDGKFIYYSIKDSKISKILEYIKIKN
ncbi:ArsR/SmtB family transcription factor [Methanococcus voltae]|uniref:Transcriptional regulator, ArsR family n=1 Tax=Methanococcus voltae (strain ATCC BAA-1334 / A3) TaxID=456320 RepID=D7DQI7_METV3|nr:metalloregulator ArsR/SmtB family transcription factor [Methanococcus voltae]MCS3901651.1 DNA-binding transcriptional ArsR family regulator [Methanococcus voltae]